MGLDFEYPPHNTALMPYFQEETIENLQLLQEYPDRSIPLSLSVYDEAFVTYGKEGMNQVANMMLASYIRINEHFIVPVNFAALFPLHFNFHVEPNEEEMYFKLLAAGGLIVQNRFWLLGAFMGYNYNYSYYISVRTEQYYDEQWGDYYTETHVGHVDETSHNFKWTIVPLVNTAKFPLLGSAVKTIMGYLGLDELDSISWSVRLVSQQFSFGPFRFQAIEPYYAKETYNLQTKNQYFGLKFNIMLNNTMLQLDMGYRDFFDTEGYWYYDDTLFGRLLITLGNYKPDDWVGLTFYIDSKFLLPKIGCIWKPGKWIILGEVGYYKNVFNFVFSAKFGLY
jgi:hypothetical protein